MDREYIYRVDMLDKRMIPIVEEGADGTRLHHATQMALQDSREGQW
jgi:hypothetical protein